MSHHISLNLQHRHLHLSVGCKKMTSYQQNKKRLSQKSLVAWAWPNMFQLMSFRQSIWAQCRQITADGFKILRTEDVTYQVSSFSKPGVLRTHQNSGKPKPTTRSGTLIKFCHFFSFSYDTVKVKDRSHYFRLDSLCPWKHFSSVQPSIKFTFFKKKG